MINCGLSPQEGVYIMSIRTALCAAAALFCLAPLSAQAATYTFAGQIPSGTDPMGDNYEIFSGPSNGDLTNLEEGAGEQEDPTQQALFDPSAMGLANATSFTLTETNAADKIIPLSRGFGVFFEVYDSNSDYLGDWDAVESSSGKSITFTAPAGLTLTPGERFSFDITFDKSLPNNFAYDITWGGDPAPAPEPATWALMLGGVGLAGGVLRRRQRASGVAAA